MVYATACRTVPPNTLILLGVCLIIFFVNMSEEVPLCLTMNRLFVGYFGNKRVAPGRFVLPLVAELCSRQLAIIRISFSRPRPTWPSVSDGFG